MLLKLFRLVSISAHAAKRYHLECRPNGGILADLAQSVSQGQMRFHSDLLGELRGMETTPASQRNRREVTLENFRESELAAMESVAYGKGEVPKGFERFASAFAKFSADAQEARIVALQAQIDAMRPAAPVGLSESQRKWLVSDLRQLLSKRLQETVSQPLPVSKYRPVFLTAHETEMYGASPKAALQEAESILKCSEEPKEKRPLILLTSSPRQGKSRWLDELAKSIIREGDFPAAPGEEKLFPILMTYNGSSSLQSHEAAPQQFLRHFLARALLSLVGQPGRTMVFLARHGFIADMTVGDFRAVVDELFDIQDRTIVLLVDEFSKLVDKLDERFVEQTAKTLSGMTELYSVKCKLVFTGFKTTTAATLGTCSSHPVVQFSLPLVDHSCPLSGLFV
jgi:hypothetical protein